MIVPTSRLLLLLILRFLGWYVLAAAAGLAVDHVVPGVGGLLYAAMLVVAVWQTVRWMRRRG
jgi:predicted PurR-regulated permease PerM